MKVKSSQVKSSQVKSSQVKSSQVKSSQVKSSQVKSSQVKSSQVKSSQVKSSQVIFIHKPLQVKVTNAQKIKNTPNTLKRLQGELKGLFKLQPKLKDDTNDTDYTHKLHVIKESSEICKTEQNMV